MAHEHPSEENIDAKSFGYQYNRLYKSIPTGIFECHSSCKCAQSCGNRVVQKPLNYRLELFKTKDCGWGVRTLNDLPEGTFISCYFGDLLPDAELDERALETGEQYFFTLAIREDVDLNAAQSKQMKKSNKTNQDAPQSKRMKKSNKINQDAPQMKRTKKKETNQHIFNERHIYGNYFPSMIGFDHTKDRKGYAVDAKRRGNFTRFINVRIKIE